MGNLTSKIRGVYFDNESPQVYQALQDFTPGVGDVRLRQPMALSVDIGSEAGGGPSSDEEKPIRPVQPPRSFPTVYGVAVLAAFTVVFAIVYGLDVWLPSALSTEEAYAYPNRFNAHRAHERLIELTEIGVKTAGSRENDNIAKSWIEEQLKNISKDVDSSKTIELDTQYITGSFDMAFHNRFTSFYDGLVNVVARLRDRRSNCTQSLLVNCHFDSVPTSPGTSDDGVNCANMLEVLQILSQQETFLNHSIIFLFNGAEENILQGAHGFITKHKWAQSVKAYVNLEACGAGGRQVLFQTAEYHPWLLEAYAESVPYPHGFVIGEEIFQSGIIPSDTDFRIFRDFSRGRLPGLDFAYYRNGYVYHTKYDNLAQISKESIKQAGDNLLALLSNLANSPYLSGPHEHTGNKTVFWDLFGFKMVYYSQTTGAVLGISIILLSVYTTVSTLLHLGPGMRRKELCVQGLKALVGPLLGWVMAFVWCCLIALFLDFIMIPMPWYSQPLMIVPLYVAPTFLFASLGLYLQYILTRLSPLCGEVRVQLYSLGVQLIWTVLLMALTLMRSRSAYLLQLMVFFPSLASFLVLWFARPGGKIGLWLWLEFGALAIPTSIAFYHVLIFLNLFIPIMGRVGTHTNSEMIIACASCISTLLCTSYLAPMVPLLKSPRRVFEALALVHLIGLAIALSPLSFPYSGDDTSPAPQRVYIFQVQRQFFADSKTLLYNDSGLWFLNVDRNGANPLLSELPILSDSRVVASDCQKDLLCGLPVYSPRWLNMCPGSLWLPTKEFPAVNVNTSVILRDKTRLSDKKYRLNFEFTGPSHLGVVLCPRYNVSLARQRWFSQQEEDVFPTGLHGDRPYYFVYVGREYRKVDEPWKLSVDLEVSPGYQGNLTDVILLGHYFTDVPDGDALIDIKANLPEWSHATIWSSWFKSHVF